MQLNPEHFLVPFQSSDLLPGPWVVFAPHADDETFGMGGTLIKASKQGIKTIVVVMTDGALGGDADDLIETRQREAQQAAMLLGVATVCLWSEPDRGLESSVGLTEKIIKILQDLQPAAVFFPGPLEIHPDHRAAAFAVWAALQKISQKSEKGPVAASYEIGVQNPANYLIDITAEMQSKEAVMEIYASQNEENNYPDLVRSLNKSRTLTLPPEVEYAEGFFRYSAKDLQSTLQEITHQIIDLYQ